MNRRGAVCSTQALSMNPLQGPGQELVLGLGGVKRSGSGAKTYGLGQCFRHTCMHTFTNSMCSSALVWPGINVL